MLWFCSFLASAACANALVGVQDISIEELISGQKLNAISLSGKDVLRGPYKVTSKKFAKQPGFDSSDPDVVVWYPEPLESTDSFPFISYSHGYSGGGLITYLAYDLILEHIASFGYVIAVPAACNTECHDDKTSLPLDPKTYAHYYYQQLKAIEWAQRQPQSVPAFAHVNFSMGVGVAGHSMGGQATLFSSAYNSSSHRIKAAVMHHAYTHTYPPPQVPFLAFTGSADTTAPPEMTHQFYNAPHAYPVRGLVNKKGAKHLEPNPLPGEYNPVLAQFTAAWFKLHLENVTQQFNIDFEALLKGDGPQSLCNGGDGEVVECEFAG